MSSLTLSKGAETVFDAMPATPPTTNVSRALTCDEGEALFLFLSLFLLLSLFMFMLIKSLRAFIYGIAAMEIKLAASAISNNSNRDFVAIGSAFVAFIAADFAATAAGVIKRGNTSSNIRHFTLSLRFNTPYRYGLIEQ